MKKVFFFAFAAFLMFACTDRNAPSNPNAKNGALPGMFSVSEKTQVQFSQGNLQYQASTGTWRFAEFQYDVLGDANNDISSTNANWIDLFGWGTGDAPTEHNVDDAAAYSAFTDWGTNPIANGGNTANTWRTLTRDEWTYLFFTREKADKLFGFGTVNGVRGVIILPDNWTLPSGCTFNPSTEHGLYLRDYYYHNDMANNFSHNSYTAKQWNAMEAAGAVFLAVNGYRYNVERFAKGEGFYWSSTPLSAYYSDPWESRAACLDFEELNLQANESYRLSGCSVRLVH